MATQNPTVSTSVLTGKVAAIGTVKMVIGTVSATSSDGVVRVLQVGDKVNANDVIQTGDLSSIDIEFVNGTHMDLGRNAQTVLDTDVFNPAAAQAAVADAAAIQALIAAGADPTAIAAATAAGAGEASEGGHSFVQVDPNYSPGNVTSGFETDVVTRTFLTTEGQVLGPITPTVSVAGVDVGLGGGANFEGQQVTFQVSLSSPVSADTVVLVNVFTGPGNTATEVADYTPLLSKTVIIPAGSTSETFPVDTFVDEVFEGNETFSAQIVSATSTGSTINVDASAATGTIIDIDAPPAFSINDVTVTEGTDPTITFTVTKAGATDVAATVDYAVNPNTATTPADYSGVLSGTLSFAPGETSKTITLNVTDDSIYELQENFNVALSGATNATIADGTGVGTINDNDTAPAFSINDVTVTEGTDPTITFTVTKAGATAVAATVDYAVNPNTATTPADYSGVLSGTLSFAPGETSKTITLNVTDDSIYELQENFNVALSGATNATIADGTGVGTINDNDTAPAFSINDVTVTEGTDPTITFTVTKAGATAVAATVDYAVNPNTATTPADYSGVLSGTLSFAPGETSKTITLNVTDDSIYELQENFNVALSGATNATIADGTGVGTINDNDAQMLDLHLVTNTNNDVQFVLMTFTDLDSTGHTYSTVIPLDSEGQQRDFQLAFDTGFNIDPTHQYKVTLQYLGNDDPGNGNDSIQITDLAVEGVGIVTGGGGHFQLGTGSADDLMVATVQPSAGGTVIGTASDLVPSASGTADNDLITGDGTLSGLAGNDKLIGGDGTDTLSGGLDSDILVGGAGNDALDGDNNVGIDTADYSSATSGVIVNLATGTATGGAGTDTLAEIENVIGSNFNDTLTGSTDHNFLSGIGGDDTLSGGDHNDLLAGGKGNDILSGNAGNDVLFGGEGTDTLAGGVGADILSGGKNADAFVFKVADLGQGMDTITDFKIAEGDVLDVSAVLSGTGFDGNPTNLGTFLKFDTTTSPGNTIISVDLDGTGTGSAVPLVTLQGVTTDLASLLGNIDYTMP